MFMDKAILDVNGNIVACEDLIVWGKWMGTGDRIIGRDEFKIDDQTIKVSTVFLGLNHSFTPSYELWFETMIFGGINDGWQDRYSTREQALIGHQKALELAKKNEKIED